ncbi:hypothetical protein D5086_033412 [Populus alba]|uniref:Uncharacterized protein n=1 Tax=Populus alba TaxID=43335 RepID=A0ACC4AGQ9_POPAL
MDFFKVKGLRKTHKPDPEKDLEEKPVATARGVKKLEWWRTEKEQFYVLIPEEESCAEEEEDEEGEGETNSNEWRKAMVGWG